MIRYLIWIGEHGVQHAACLKLNSLSQGSDQEKTFGPTISGLIHKHIGPERLLLWDSKARGGRPDSMKILKEAYTYWDAEGKFRIDYTWRRAILTIGLKLSSSHQTILETLKSCKDAKRRASHVLEHYGIS